MTFTRNKPQHHYKISSFENFYLVLLTYIPNVSSEVNKNPEKHEQALELNNEKFYSSVFKVVCHIFTDFRSEGERNFHFLHRLWWTEVTDFVVVANKLRGLIGK